MPLTARILALVFIVSGCTSTPTVERPLREVVTGQWGWTAEECRKSPKSISFSSDGGLMYYQSTPGASGLLLGDQVLDKVTYQILGEGRRVLRTIIEGETRKTESGNVVMWDLVLRSNDSFCWHRTDWAANACTRPVSRCD